MAGGFRPDGTWDNDFAVARYTTDGALDTSFHADGMLTSSMNYLNMPVVGRVLASAWKREDIYGSPDKLDEAYQLGQTIAAGK